MDDVTCKCSIATRFSSFMNPVALYEWMCKLISVHYAESSLLYIKFSTNSLLQKKTVTGFSPCHRFKRMLHRWSVTKTQAHNMNEAMWGQVVESFSYHIKLAMYSLYQNKIGIYTD
jgi:hypothetical protein